MTKVSIIVNVYLECFYSIKWWDVIDKVIYVNKRIISNSILNGESIKNYWNLNGWIVKLARFTA